MNLREFKANNGKKSIVSTSRGERDALVLFFIARVKECMLELQSQLYMRVEDFSIVIAGIRNSEELIWIYNLTFQEYFTFEKVRNLDKGIVIAFKYSGVEGDELRAWKAMAFALEVFKEEFSNATTMPSDQDIDKAFNNARLPNKVEDARKLLKQF